MIVRCGRCGVELEVSGPGEFACPSCGTRNAVRGAAAPVDPYDLGGLSVPEGAPPPSQPVGGAPQPETDITWSTCPTCGWRFAHGGAEQVTCPSCRATLKPSPEGLQPVEAD